MKVSARSAGGQVCILHLARFNDFPGTKIVAIEPVQKTKPREKMVYFSLTAKLEWLTLVRPAATARAHSRSRNAFGEKTLTSCLTRVGGPEIVEGDFTASDYERRGKTIQKSPQTLFLQGLQAVFDYNRRSTNMSEHTHLAEAVRFELTNGVSRRRFSRPVHSTTLPHFRSCFLTVGAILSENGYELSHMCCV